MTSIDASFQKCLCMCKISSSWTKLCRLVCTYSVWPQATFSRITIILLCPKAKKMLFCCTMGKGPHLGGIFQSVVHVQTFLYPGEDLGWPLQELANAERGLLTVKLSTSDVTSFFTSPARFQSSQDKLPPIIDGIKL